MAKKKKWSQRVVKRAREIVEFNLANPMVRDDAREHLPRANVKNRGMKIDPNTLLVVHLRHHRPALFWDCTISWGKMPPVNLENISEWAYDLMRLVLFEEEIKAGDWDFFPAHMETPMVTVVTPYIPQIVEQDAYDNLVRERKDHEKYDIGRLLGTTAVIGKDGKAIVEDAPDGSQIVIPTSDQVKQLG